MHSVLVTGGAGFVGSHVSVGLAEKHPDWEITALDNLRRRGSEYNLERLRAGGVKYVHGDMRIASDLPDISSGPDLIIDCAAEPSVFSGLTDNPRYLIESNLMGTCNCLEYARSRGSSVIFISTSRIYPMARLGSLPFVEEGTRFDIPENFKADGISYHGVAEGFNAGGARSLYGYTKLASEMLLEEYAAAYGLKFIINRCGTITGPGQMGKVEQGVFALWMAAHYFKRPLSYMSYGGAGKQVRDFLHIADLVDLIDWQSGQVEKLSGERYNIGGGRAGSLSLTELTHLCSRVTGNSVKIESSPDDRKNDIKWYITDFKKASSLCGWRPKQDTLKAAEDILNWLRGDEKRLKGVFTR